MYTFIYIYRPVAGRDGHDAVAQLRQRDRELLRHVGKPAWSKLGNFIGKNFRF